MPGDASNRVPRVAVIIPCHNDGATLIQTVASLEEEEPHELAIVDDGSNEPVTRDVLDRLSREREGVRVLRQKNAGPGAARMAGVHATSAPYLFPLDADDVLAPGALAALADALDRHPEAAAAWGDELTFGDAQVYKRTANCLDPWLVTYANEQPLASLMRREALLEAGGWQIQSGYEDWDLWMSFAERGYEGVRVPRVVNFYRIGAGRRWAGDRARHDAIYAELRARHPELFARRGANWYRARAPWRTKVLFPVIERVPGLSDYQRYRLDHLVAHPLRSVGARLQRSA